MMGHLDCVDKSRDQHSLGNTRKLRQFCTCMLLSIWYLGKQFEVVFDKDRVTKERKIFGHFERVPSA